MERYTISKLGDKIDNHRWNVVHINNKEEYDKLKKYFPNMDNYNYNYYLISSHNSGTAQNKSTYEESGYFHINFEQIDFEENLLNNIQIW